jgi:hypothetical protein
LRRRKFITLLGGAAAGWPLVARSQTGKLPTIAYLGGGHPLESEWLAGFVRRLGELG